MAQVFRKSSLERAAAPDRLDDYIQVSNPSVWMVLIAILLLLAGGLVWACFANLSDEQRCAVEVTDGKAVCYVDQANAADLTMGDVVDVSGAEGSVASVSSEATPFSSLSATAQDALQSNSGWVYAASASIDLPDGVYAGTVTTREYHPLALLFGRE